MKNVYENEMKLEFLSKSSNESFARIAVAAFVAQLDPTIEEISDIKTAVSEAVTNSIIHGYENKEGLIKINCKIFANTVEIEIIDNGKGIEDIKKAREALYTTKPELERSGMGFTIMESFMDELKVESTVRKWNKNNYEKNNKTIGEICFMYEINTKDLIKAQNNDNEALTKIIETNSGLLWSIVKRFLGRGYDKEELYQIACIRIYKSYKKI